jgi:hypothetical protein
VLQCPFLWRTMHQSKNICHIVRHLNWNGDPISFGSGGL